MEILFPEDGACSLKPRNWKRESQICRSETLNGAAGNQRKHGSRGVLGRLVWSVSFRDGSKLI